jgi:tRNA modification GTPase
MSHQPLISTRATILTPPGRGAVAVVRVWGNDAVRVADAAFRPNQGARLAKAPRGRLRVGRMGAGLGDEVVAVVLESEPVEVEVQCHGGPAPLELVMAALESAGALRYPQHDWIRQSRPSPLSAQAAIDLAHAPTVRAAEILLDQLNGALETEVRAILGRIASKNGSVLEAIDTLIARSAVGLRILAGWRVVLAGRPNVGKSRLLNALAGFERAIVDPTPGTTRDVLTVRTAIDGWPVELADTAGLRDSGDPVEASGVAMARAQHAGADLVLLVLDGSEPLTEADRLLVAQHPGALWVTNKADLPASWEPHGPRRLVVSAERGDNLDALWSAIAVRIVPAPPPPGSAVPFHPAHVRLLTRARAWLATGRTQAASRALERMLGGSGMAHRPRSGPAAGAGSSGRTDVAV